MSQRILFVHDVSSKNYYIESVANVVILFAYSLSTMGPSKQFGNDRQHGHLGARIMAPGDVWVDVWVEQPTR